MESTRMFKHITILVPAVAKSFHSNAITAEKKESQRTTLYKNNSDLISKLNVSKYKKGLYLTEKLMRKSPLLFLY